MKNIILRSQKKFSSYPIYIGRGLLDQIPKLVDIKKYSKIFIIADNRLELFLKKMLSVLPKDTSYIALPTSDSNKNIETLQRIWASLQINNCDRKSLVINLGGGVITDIGGFAAATYMRGIEFINIPTTLLSQVDASIGGKTGINFGNVKNLLGTFSQPIAVIIDTETLTTLAKRELLSGYAEMIKHALILDKKYFYELVSLSPARVDKDELIDIITKSLEIKKRIVEEDETESERRKILNFGHTIGHAIESLSLKTKQPLLHGETISMGMVVEARISNLLGLLKQEELDEIINYLTNIGLPVDIGNIDRNEILTLVKYDKKNEKGVINFTLLSNIGRAVINQKPSISVVKKALK